MLNCLYFILGIEQEIFLHSIYRENFFEKIFGIFHFNSYLCSAVPVRPSPRLFDAGDDPGVFVFAKVHNSFDCNNKKSIFFAFSRYLLHSQTFSNNSLHLSEEKRIFAEEKLHSAICKQVYIALVCIFFAKEMFNF